MGAIASATGVDPSSRLKLAVEIVGAGVGFVGMLLAMLIASAQLRRDLDARVAVMLFSKPLSKLMYLAGRSLGVIAVLLVGLALMAAAGSVAVAARYGATPEMRTVVAPESWSRIAASGELVPIAPDRPQATLAGLIGDGVEYRLVGLPTAEEHELLLRADVRSSDPSVLKERVATQVLASPDGAAWTALAVVGDSPYGQDAEHGGRVLLRGRDVAACQDLSVDYCRLALPASLVGGGRIGASARAAPRPHRGGGARPRLLGGGRGRWRLVPRQPRARRAHRARARPSAAVRAFTMLVAVTSNLPVALLGRAHPALQRQRAVGVARHPRLRRVIAGGGPPDQARAGGASRFRACAGVVRPGGRPLGGLVGGGACLAFVRHLWPGAALARVGGAVEARAVSRTRLLLLAGVALLVAAQLLASLPLASARKRLEPQGGGSGFTDITPGEFAGTLMLGGFRGLACDLLWIRADSARQSKRFYESLALYRTISRIQPRFEEVWTYLAWDMAYNIGSDVEDKGEKWSWMLAGLDADAEGCRRNPQSEKLPAPPGLDVQPPWRPLVQRRNPRARLGAADRSSDRAGEQPARRRSAPAVPRGRRSLQLPHRRHHPAVAGVRLSESQRRQVFPFEPRSVPLAIECDGDVERNRGDHLKALAIWIESLEEWRKVLPRYATMSSDPGDEARRLFGLDSWNRNEGRLRRKAAAMAKLLALDAASGEAVANDLLERRFEAAAAAIAQPGWRRTATYGTIRWLDER